VAAASIVERGNTGTTPAAIANRRVVVETSYRAYGS
jgi:hypothetical protein